MDRFETLNSRHEHCRILAGTGSQSDRLDAADALAASLSVVPELPLSDRGRVLYDLGVVMERLCLQHECETAAQSIDFYLRAIACYRTICLSGEADAIGGWLRALRGATFICARAPLATMQERAADIARELVEADDLLGGVDPPLLQLAEAHYHWSTARMRLIDSGDSDARGIADLLDDCRVHVDRAISLYGRTDDPSRLGEQGHIYQSAIANSCLLRFFHDVSEDDFLDLAHRCATTITDIRAVSCSAADATGVDADEMVAAVRDRYIEYVATLLDPDWDSETILGLRTATARVQQSYEPPITTMGELEDWLDGCVQEDPPVPNLLELIEMETLRLTLEGGLSQEAGKALQDLYPPPSLHHVFFAARDICALPEAAWVEALRMSQWSWSYSFSNSLDRARAFIEGETAVVGHIQVSLKEVFEAISDDGDLDLGGKRDRAFWVAASCNIHAADWPLDDITGAIHATEEMLEYLRGQGDQEILLELSLVGLMSRLAPYDPEWRAALIKLASSIRARWAEVVGSQHPAWLGDDEEYCRVAMAELAARSSRN